MEMHEKSKVVEEVVEKKDNVREISVRCHIFFDGTLNNRTNIEQRLLSVSDEKLTEQERIEASELREKNSAEEQLLAKEHYDEFGGEFSDDTNSYEGYYTNIVLMDRYVEDAVNYDITVKAYIEGSGSMNMAEDEQDGYAFGKGISGVKAKVEKALDEALNKIGVEVNMKYVVNNLTLDVFGFSRGAASARYFIHQALNSEESISKKLKDKGYAVNKVEVCFAGLFDTVSTFGYGIVIGLANNVKELKLEAISNAKNAIHLTSADEHRTYFSLTNINSAGEDGKEIFLPGVHSDIGGGYRDNVTEQQEIFKSHSSGSVENEKKRLIEAGWYKEHELEITSRWVRGAAGKRNKHKVSLRCTRESISNHYSRIPLHLMVKYSKENDLNFKRKMDSVEKIPNELESVMDNIKEYIAETSNSKATDWIYNNDSWLCNLRHDYFHYSANYKTGHDPRFSKGQRFRKTYNG